MKIQQLPERKRLYRNQQEQYSKMVFQIAIFISLGLVTLLFYSYPRFERVLKEIPTVRSTKFEVIKALSIPPDLIKEEPEDTSFLCFLPINMTKPIITKRIFPDYPEDAKMAAVEGVVVIQVLVNESGTVDETKIIKSIPLLDKPAIEAAKQFQFKPAKFDGEFIKVWVTILFHFELE